MPLCLITGPFTICRPGLNSVSNSLVYISILAFRSNRNIFIVIVKKKSLSGPRPWLSQGDKCCWHTAYFTVALFDIFKEEESNLKFGIHYPLDVVFVLVLFEGEFILVSVIKFALRHDSYNLYIFLYGIFIISWEVCFL